MGKDERRFVNTRKTAAYHGLSPRTLDGYRVSGAGTVFHRFGNQARCRKMDLDAWAEKRRALTTAQTDRP